LTGKKKRRQVSVTFAEKNLAMKGNGVKRSVHGYNRRFIRPPRVPFSKPPGRRQRRRLSHSNHFKSKISIHWAASDPGRRRRPRPTRRSYRQTRLRKRAGLIRSSSRYFVTVRRASLIPSSFNRR